MSWAAMFFKRALEKAVAYVAPVVLQEIAGSLYKKAKEKWQERKAKKLQQKEQKEAQKEGK